MLEVKHVKLAKEDEEIISEFLQQKNEINIHQQRETSKARQNLLEKLKVQQAPKPTGEQEESIISSTKN